MLRPNAAQRLLYPRSSPLPNVDSTSAKTGFEVCSAEGVPCTARRASFNSVTHKASRDLLLSLSLTVFHSLSPSHIEPFDSFLMKPVWADRQSG